MPVSFDADHAARSWTDRHRACAARTSTHLDCTPCPRELYHLVDCAARQEGARATRAAARRALSGQGRHLPQSAVQPHGVRHMMICATLLPIITRADGGRRPPRPPTWQLWPSSPSQSCRVRDACICSNQPSLLWQLARRLSRLSSRRRSRSAPTAS